MKISLYTIMIALLLAGCGESPQPPPPKTKLFEPQRGALDKAKGVEQTVNQQADQQKQDVERQAN
jgi:hypothetical protein